MVARRPPNRKELIRAGATELFVQRGYHNVSVADVADALGVTASALYHHYRNKQDLLLQVVLGGLDTVDDLLRQAEGLDTALRGLAALVVGPRRTVAMWERQARHLDPAQREVLVARQAEVVAHLIPLLRGARPGLSDADGELIARAVLGVLGSPARHRLTLPRRRHENLLFRLGAIAAHSELPKRELLPDHSDQGRRGTTAGLDEHDDLGRHRRAPSPRSRHHHRAGRPRRDGAAAVRRVSSLHSATSGERAPTGAEV